MVSKELVYQLSCTVCIFSIILFKVLKNKRVKKITKEYLFQSCTILEIYSFSLCLLLYLYVDILSPQQLFYYVGISGEFATAGYGAGTRIEQVVLLPILGINTAIITIIAQNFGAKNLDRVKETYIGAIQYSLMIMIVCSLLIFIFLIT